MRHFIITLTLLMTVCQLNAQELTKEMVSGVWKVVNVELLEEAMGIFPDNMREFAKQTSKGFMGSTITLNNNGDFSMKNLDTTSELVKEMGNLDNLSWEIKDGNRITVTNNMIILVPTVIDGKRFFLIGETGIAIKSVPNLVTIPYSTTSLQSSKQSLCFTKLLHNLNRPVKTLINGQ